MVFYLKLRGLLEEKYIYEILLCDPTFSFKDVLSKYDSNDYEYMGSNYDTISFRIITNNIKIFEEFKNNPNVLSTWSPETDLHKEYILNGYYIVEYQPFKALNIWHQLSTSRDDFLNNIEFQQ